MATDSVAELLAPTVAGLGYELLGIERGQAGGGALIRLYIDGPNGIGIEDCELVSRQVSDILDVEDAIRGEYTLEVSSPGSDRPLFTPAQFSAYVGETVSMRLRTLVEGRRRLTGKLVEADDRQVVVDVDGESIAVPFNLVERARLVPQW